MSLLDDLHRRVDGLTPDQQRSLKLWLDYQQRRSQRGESDDLAEFANGAARFLARMWPEDDWSREYEQWKKSQGRADATG